MFYFTSVHTKVILDTHQTKIKQTNKQTNKKHSSDSEQTNETSIGGYKKTPVTAIEMRNETITGGYRNTPVTLNWGTRPVQ